MTIAVDTNVLLRLLTDDDPRQSELARKEVETADGVVIATAALCEVVWVLARGYRYAPDRIAQAVRNLIDARNVICERGVVLAGLAQLDDGGDFADGVIAYEGFRLGASTFVSFDRAAVRLIARKAQAARLLA